MTPPQLEDKESEKALGIRVTPLLASDEVGDESLVEELRGEPS
jgi:hypothetical protein